MLSSHSGSAFAHGAILVLWVLAGVLLIIFVLRWRRGRRRWVWAAASILCMAAAIWTWSASHHPADRRASAPLSPQQQAVMAIVVKRCQACHSDHATMMSYASFSLSLNSMQDVDEAALPIYRQVVEYRQMPMGNTTHMTDDERAIIARWYASRQHGRPAGKSDSPGP